ncbi:MAG TPA: alpha/beta hydrolase [Novosphingobium sp.]
MSDDYRHRSIWGHLMKLAFCQNYVDAGGIRTRYVEAGPKDAPVLLMIHGTGSSWECFCATLESHSQHFRCIAIDLAGSGFSDRPDEPYEIGFYVKHVIAFMDTMGIAKASFIGVSLGAWVTSRLVVNHPERVEKITLLASSGLIINNATMSRTKTVRNAAVDDPSWENIKPVFNSILYKEEDRIPDLIQLRQAIYREPNMKMAMNNILVLQNEDVRRRNLVTEEEWRGVKVPIFIIIAPDDNPDYTVTGKRIAELASDVRTLTIDKVKHWAHFEAPEIFNPANIAFLLGEEQA